MLLEGVRVQLATDFGLDTGGMDISVALGELDEGDSALTLNLALAMLTMPSNTVFLLRTTSKQASYTMRLPSPSI
jgi:hypothetical protein